MNRFFSLLGAAGLDFICGDAATVRQPPEAHTLFIHTRQTRVKMTFIYIIFKKTDLHKPGIKYNDKGYCREMGLLSGETAGLLLLCNIWSRCFAAAGRQRGAPQKHLPQIVSVVHKVRQQAIQQRPRMENTATGDQKLFVLVQNECPEKRRKPGMTEANSDDSLMSHPARCTSIGGKHNCTYTDLELASSVTLSSFAKNCLSSGTSGWPDSVETDIDDLFQTGTSHKWGGIPSH